MKLTSFQKRILSALVLGPIAFMIIWHGGPLFALFVLLWAAFAFYEWVFLALKVRYKILTLLIGVIYVSIAFWCCYLLRAQFSPGIPLLFICMVWASDVGAYAFGKSIGGPKMASEISPNKTWAGFTGALLCPAILCFLYLFIRGTGVQGIEILIAAITGIAMGVVGQAGDLAISFLKRRAGVKDSGHLIPGHGGVLDRVDALMLTAPVFLFIVTKFSHVFTG